MVGILASVAAAHAVLAIALMTGGGCRQTKILAPHTYNNGPEVAEMPSAVDKPGNQGGQTEVPPSGGGDTPLPPPPETVQPTPVAPVSTGTKTYKVKKGDTLSGIAYKYGVRTRDLAACNNLSGKAANNIRVGQELTIPEGGVYNESRTPKRSPKKATKPAAKKPAKPARKAELPADGVYVVKSGDSLDRIGRRYGVSAKAIAKENNIALNKVLQIGDKLRIPGKAAASADTIANTSKTDEPTSVDNSNLLNDLDPNAGLENNSGSAATAADSAANTTGTEAAAMTENTANAVDTTQYDSLEVQSDITIEDFCDRNKVSVAEIRKLNPEIPADGKLKAGFRITLPRLQ